MIKTYIQDTIQKALKKIGVVNKNITVDHPTNSDFGDYTSNIAMQLAKDLKKNPMQIAEEIASHIQKDSIIAKVDVVRPGFLNIWITKEFLLKKTHEYSENLLHQPKKINKTIIIEYSSPNIAKPFTIGHLRSTIIGDTVANLYQEIGYQVHRDNHLGDWGTQFGKQIYAIQNWSSVDEIDSLDRPVKKLVELYVKFHEEAEKNPAIEEEGRKWFKKLEDNDQVARELWQKCIDWSWKEFDLIYQKLNVSFTVNKGRGYGESYFEDKMTEVLQELKEKDLLSDSQGAKVVFFPDEKYPPLMIIKQDGATLYATRDLATDKFRLKQYGKDITIVNEVGIEQSLYFNQLFEIEEMLGWYKKEQRIHLKHGHYRFKDQKMSTRKGNVIWLEDVLEEAEKRALVLTNHKNEFNETDVKSINKKFSRSSHKHTQKFSEQINNASIIGIGALKWNDLKRSSHQDIIFDWDDILNMQGNSGPYMQYTYARCISLLEKGTLSDFDTNNHLNFNNDELEIMRILIKFPEIIEGAAYQFSPNILCTYLFELAQQFNLFYQKNPILKVDDETKYFRLLLTRSVAKILKHGLYLLGIKTVEKM